MFMWYMHLLLGALLLFSKIIEFLLSWYIMFSKISYPWASNQYLVHSIAGIQSSTATIPVSVELRLFSFCFVELKMGNPLTVDRPTPVCPLMFGCTANDPSIHNFSIPLPLKLSVSGGFLVRMIYFIRCTKFSQSSFSGSLNLVVRNKIVVQVSDLACLVENNIFSARWWNSIVFLAFSFYSLRRPLEQYLVHHLT